MSASLHIDILLTDFFENAREIGRLEEQHKQTVLNGDIDKMFDIRIRLDELFVKRYTIQREIHEAYEIKERSKTRFQRLFHK